MKIYVAEDEVRARNGLCRLIEGTEHELVGTASNGQTALEQILQLKPDVVFTDIKMPFLDGLSLIRAVNGHRRSVEFVVVSAYADFEFARQAISLGVSEYLLKPVTQEELMQVLAKIQAKREGGHVEEQQDSELRNRYPNAHPLVAKSLGAIQTRFSEKISQKDLASELGLTQEYFSYLFARDVGENFSVFLRRYRIDMARRLYRQGQEDRRDVPYLVGFSDAKYFAKVFRIETGQSPTEFCDSLDR